MKQQSSLGQGQLALRALGTQVCRQEGAGSVCQGSEISCQCGGNTYTDFKISNSTFPAMQHSIPECCDQHFVVVPSHVHMTLSNDVMLHTLALHCLRYV